jgi:RNA polymerase sigma factor (sigma-70 family)
MVIGADPGRAWLHRMRRAPGSRLMRRFRDGDPEAVAALYERYGRAVFTVAYGALGDRGLAEEAVQQTFLQAWRAAARFEPDHDPAPWLYSIARRVAVDLYRRERRHETVDWDEPEVAVLSPSFEGTWEAWEVRTALDKLSAEERDVLRATHYLGLTHEETAARLGIPVGTVKSRSYRAHRRMAALLAHLQEASA